LLKWGCQQWQVMEKKSTYVELHEPRSAACVRFWEVCALLSKAIDNKAARAHAFC